MSTRFTSDEGGIVVFFQFSKGPESITKTMDRNIDVWDIPMQNANLLDDFRSTKLTYTIDGSFNEADGTIDVGKGGGTIKQMRDALEDLTMPENEAVGQSNGQPMYLFSDEFFSEERVYAVQITRVVTTISGTDPLRIRYSVECVGGERLI